MTEKKKRGRKKLDATVEIMGPEFSNEVDPEVLARETAAMENYQSYGQHLNQIDSNYGQNLPYDKARLESECRFYLETSATSMLEAGKRLVLLKEHEKHGEFTNALNRIGITERAARKMMQASIKFCDPKRPSMAVLGSTKLLELMVEDDDDLDALAEGGTLAGLTLDKIDKMSVRELKATLRKEREKHAQEQEANEKLLTSKNETIDKYARDAERVHEWPEVVESLKTDIGRQGTRCEEAICSLLKLIDTIHNEAKENKLSDGQIGTVMNAFSAELSGIDESLSDLARIFEERGSLYVNLPDHVRAFADEPKD